MAVTEMLVKSGTHCATHCTNTENDSLCYKRKAQVFKTQSPQPGKPKPVQICLPFITQNCGAVLCSFTINYNYDNKKELMLRLKLDEERDKWQTGYFLRAEQWLCSTRQAQAARVPGSQL